MIQANSLTTANAPDNAPSPPMAGLGGGADAGDRNAEAPLPPMAGLGGLNVLDLCEEEGLMCGQLLADMGAHVHQLVSLSKADLLASDFWRAYTLGKRIEVIDWRQAPQLVTGFAAEADVLLESCGPAKLEALGIRPDALYAANPGLIHVSITSFGATGPKAGYAATDLISAAASGHVQLSGPRSGAPLRITADQAQAHAASDAAVGVLIALADRERSGLGQHLDISAQQSMTLALLCRSLDKPCAHPPAERSAYALQLGEISLQTQFRCADGWVVTLQGVLPPLAGFMQRLMAWVLEEGHCAKQDLQWDWGSVGARMALGQVSTADWAPVQNGIERLLAGRRKAELMQAALSRRLLLAPVFTLDELLDSEQMAVRQCVVAGPSGKRLGAFAKFSRSPLPLGPAPPPEFSPASATAKAMNRRHSLTPSPEFSPASPADGDSPPLPLAAVKVLDLFWVMAGPGATRMLADYGATVVHVESSRRIDMMRNVPPYISGQIAPERAAAHHSTNANKLNIALDISSAEGKEVLRDLIAWADVLTESFAPGVMERLGFSYANAAAINPDIIMISSALMGQTGPWRSYAGYGNLGAAVSGFHALAGQPGEPPAGCFGPYTDFTSVRFNALAILLALQERRRTGIGQHIDMAQAEAALQFLAPQCLAYWRNGEKPEALGNRHSKYAPQGLYPVRGDDRWLALSIRDDDDWRRLCDLSQDAALKDARHWPQAERRRRHDELDARLSAWLADQDGSEAERSLQAANLPAHQVLDTYQLFEDPQLNHRQHFLTAPHVEFGPVAIESTRLRFSRSQPRQPQAAPHFGIDNHRVLEDILGYDGARLAELRKVGALR